MRGFVVLGVTVLLLVAVGTFMRGLEQGAASRATPKPPAATFAWTPPSGFAKYQADPDIAWRWAEKDEFRCSFSGGRCWGIFVVAHLGCPTSLYVELTTLDRAGNAVGLANDVVGALTPGQQANLVFDAFDDDATQARMAAINCY